MVIKIAQVYGVALTSGLMFAPPNRGHSSGPKDRPVREVCPLPSAMNSFALGLGQTRSLRSLKQFPRCSEGSLAL